MRLKKVDQLLDDLRNEFQFDLKQVDNSVNAVG